MFVSCICLSRPGRWGLLQRSILNFSRQSYVERELVVVLRDEGFAQTVESWLLTYLGDTRGIHVITRSAHHGHAEAFLHGMARAKGDVIAVWDDDNMDDRDRLEWQMAKQRVLPGFTVLDESLYFFHDTQEVFFVNYQNPSAPPAERGVVSTLMGPRDRWPEIATTWREHPISEMIGDMHGQGLKLIGLAGSGWRHVVGVRGDNSRGYDLHRRLATQLPHGKTRAWLQAHEAEVKDILARYPWDYPKLTVHGKDAVAFDYAVPDTQHHRLLYPVGKPDDDVERVEEAL